MHTVSVVTARIVRFHVHEAVLTDASLAQTQHSQEDQSHDKTKKENGSENENKNKTKNKIARPVVDWQKLQPVGRLGWDLYSVVDNSVELPRPKERALQLYGIVKPGSTLF